MKLLYIGLLCLLTIVPASATTVEQRIGPYDVIFDLTNTSLMLNSSASYWDDSNPDMAYGEVYIVPKNHPSLMVASIRIMHSELGVQLYLDYLEDSLRDEGYDDAQAYTRTIDGDSSGYLATAKNTTTGRVKNLAGYRLDGKTIVDITSFLSAEGEMRDLLDTIHVAEAKSEDGLDRIR